MKTNLPNLLTTVLVSITPITIIGSSCLPVKADGFDSINMQMNFSVIRLNDNINHRQILDRRQTPSNSSGGRRNGSGNGGRNNSRIVTGTVFVRDPAVTREIQNSLLSNVSDPQAKKFMKLYLTPENAKKIFRSFHPEEGFKFNDIADVFTITSLYSFLVIEDKSSVTSEQIRGTRQRFRKIFTGRSMDNASMQRSSEILMYWAMLIGLNNANGGASDKANAARVMTSIGLNPREYTLGDRGFVTK
jgi:hypothetical protein